MQRTEAPTQAWSDAKGELDQRAINMMRTLSIDAVQQSPGRRDRRTALA